MLADGSKHQCYQKCFIQNRGADRYAAFRDYWVIAIRIGDFYSLSGYHIQTNVGTVIDPDNFRNEKTMFITGMISFIIYVITKRKVSGKIYRNHCMEYVIYVFGGKSTNLLEYE
ncbi:hypothetical protein MJ581_19895 [Escherichia coli]|nr:hypothetical protein MJ581_19895 [Escherichia coli]